MRKIFIFCAFIALAHAELFVYGPSGPAPVINELARQFSEKTGEKITIIAGPFAQWIDQAKENADVIYAGNSSMMDFLVAQMPQQLSHNDVRVLNIREAGIVVRPGNPQHIHRFEDLTRDGIRIMVVSGAGQVGLYEDMALKGGDRSVLVKLRKNIRFYATTTAEAIDRWNSDNTLDAFIVWEHWGISLGKREATFVRADSAHILYRAAEIAITKTSPNRQQAGEFVEFLQTQESQEVWRKMGWKGL
ncbi:MAG: substrate-binding domain-containing protein [Helicobacter sp.]|nr:substrate-binding domain-containing protein [Helicobacter sp.]